MSAVVLRCPNCGTTRGAPGECDACHDADVRYYCSNHSPGRWLDGVACPQCGAKFGEPSRPPPRAPAPSARAPSPAGRTSPPPHSTRPPTPSWRETRPPPPSPASPPRAPRWPGRRTGPPSDDDRPVRGPTLDEILREATRPRRIPPEAPPAPDIGPVIRGVGGCLVRAVLLALFLIVALVIGLFVFGGALLQMFGSPY
ncbi:MAG TPA: hypothetical protein VHM00_18500 [Caldimonas sp.]|jgi:hypothetical protein|nr:hypothetical protein [Caldimonas sp.]HEX2543058.1 hypothetical protein [Caldimonas sp.]